MTPSIPSSGDAAWRLHVEIDRYEKVIDSLKALRDREGRDRLNELVRIRRALAELIALIRDAGLTAFASHPERLAEFRGKLSTVVNRTALHQADWPALALDGDPEGYRRSATALGRVQREFIAWVRGALADPPT